MAESAYAGSHEGSKADNVEKLDNEALLMNCVE